MEFKNSLLSFVPRIFSSKVAPSTSADERKKPMNGYLRDSLIALLAAFLPYHGTPQFSRLAQLCALEATPWAPLTRLKAIQHGADLTNQIDVTHLVLTANVVASANNALLKDGQKRICVILHIEPITDVFALSIDWDLLSGQGVQDHHRDQLLWEVIGPIIVRAIAQNHR